MSSAAPASRAENFYATALERLLKSGIPFMIGGAYAMREYAGIFRDTKDLDIFCKITDYPAILQVLAEVGCRTELTDPIWLAKGLYKDLLIDVIFNTGNGLAPVDETWLEHTPRVNILGCLVRLVPPEEMILSKAYVQERERFDGADVIHILREEGRTLDWKRLLLRIGAYWEVLFAHLLNFRFVYPSERDTIPVWVMQELLSRVEKQLATPPPQEPICRGPLLSRTQYEIDVTQWGYLDVRPLLMRDSHGTERVEGTRRRGRRPARSRFVQRDVPRTAGGDVRSC